MRAHTLRTPAWPLLVGMLSISIAGCTVGPNYKRPPVTTPDSYRGQALAGGGGASLADEPWSSVFTDERLQDLIRTALARNYDLQIAAARILVHALELCGKDLSREGLVTKLEGLYEYDTGLLPKITFGPNRRIGALGAYVVTLDPEKKLFPATVEWISVD